MSRRPAPTPAPAQAPSHSALYEGQVVHVRRGEVGHSFVQEVAMCFLDLDELPAVLDRHPLWSAGRGRPVQVRRADYTGDPAVPLADAARDLVQPATGVRPAGPVRLLAQPRTWGWCFNPIALAFCFAPDGATVEGVVATVTNTPWGERHDYLLAAGPDGRIDATVDKALHVSPFFGMDQSYRFRIDPPGPELDVTVEVAEGDRQVLWASLHLRRRSLDRRAMTALLLRHPAMTWRVSGGIYAQAGRLALKGARFHRHPTKSGRGCAR